MASWEEDGNTFEKEENFRKLLKRAHNAPLLRMESFSDHEDPFLGSSREEPASSVMDPPLVDHPGLASSSMEMTLELMGRRRSRPEFRSVHELGGRGSARRASASPEMVSNVERRRQRELALQLKDTAGKSPLDKFRSQASLSMDNSVGREAPISPSLLSQSPATALLERSQKEKDTSDDPVTSGNRGRSSFADQAPQRPRSAPPGDSHLRNRYHLVVTPASQSASKSKKTFDKSSNVSEDHGVYRSVPAVSFSRSPPRPSSALELFGIREVFDADYDPDYTHILTGNPGPVTFAPDRRELIIKREEKKRMQRRIQMHQQANEMARLNRVSCGTLNLCLCTLSHCLSQIMSSN